MGSAFVPSSSSVSFLRGPTFPAGTSEEGLFVSRGDQETKDKREEKQFVGRRDTVSRKKSIGRRNRERKD